MVTIPDKLQKQLEEIIKDKFVIYYETMVERRRYKSIQLNPLYNTNPLYEHPLHKELEDQALSIVKITRPMTLKDLFSEKNVDENLQNMYNIEKEVIQLRKLKNSIDNIKTFLHNESKENK